MELLHEDDDAFAMRHDFRTTEIRGAVADSKIKLDGGVEEENLALGGGGSPSASTLARDLTDDDARGSEEGADRQTGHGRKATCFFLR
jgi:hypothetical protein